MTIQHPEPGETPRAELTDADKATLKRAAEIAEVRGADKVRRWAGAGAYDVTSTLSAYVELTGIAQTLLGELAAIIRRLGDAGDDEDLGENETYRCATCGATIGHFIGHGDGWHHYRGDGTPDSPVVLYDAGHPAGLLP